MVAESPTLPDAPAPLAADRHAYLEQRIFALSPLNLWLTAALIYFALVGAYALATAIDGGVWIRPAHGGYVLDDRARIALILALVVCVALAMQRYTRLSQLAEAPTLASLSEAMTSEFQTYEGGNLKRATALGLVGGVLLILLVRAPGVGPHDLASLARFVWFGTVTVLLAVLFARGVELTRVGSGLMRRVIGEGLAIDLLHIDRLYGWGRIASRNSLTWFAVSASACLLFVSTASPLVAAGLLGACAAMGLWVFVSTMQAVHQRIHAVKTHELETVRGEISALRARPAPEPENSVRLHSLIAYEGRIAAVHEWPFNQSTLLRVLGSTLILALPWFGQAVDGILVEHIGQLIR